MMIQLYQIEKFDKVTLYLFGSTIKGVNYKQDVDVILIYDKKYITIDRVIKLKKEMFRYWKNFYNILLDITLLSTEEQREIKFIRRTNAEKII